MPKNFGDAKGEKGFAGPYKKPVSCTLTCIPRMIGKKRDDGSIDNSNPSKSYKWLSGTLTCSDGNGRRDDLWIKTEEVSQGAFAYVKASNQMRFFLYDLGEKCDCGGYHRLEKISINL